MIQLSLLQKIIIWALPVLFAITVHEVAHGFVASKLGDKTALILGRLSLNPLKHIDPLGTVIVPLILLWLGGFIFGWAKPVPINGRNFKHPRRDAALVAAAGPLANFIMAILWAAIMKLGLMMMGHGIQTGLPMMLMGQAGIMVNLILMLINLIPIPPLDGSRIVASLLPHRWLTFYDRLEPYGFLILLVLIVIGALGFIIGPGFSLCQQLLTWMFQLQR